MPTPTPTPPAQPAPSATGQPPPTVAAAPRARSRRRGDLAAFPVLLVLLAVFPLLAPVSMVNVAVFAMIYALAAIGLTLLMGLAGQVSLGHAAFFGIGAYAQAILVTRYHWHGVAAAALSVVLAMLAAVVLGLPLLRLRGHYLALATLGLGIILTVVAAESEFTGATSGIFGIPKPEFNRRVYNSPREFFWLLSPFVAGGLLLARNIVESRTGRALSAVNDSEVAAETLGVDTFWLRLQVFTVSAGYAGLAGVFYAYWLAVVNPSATSFLLSVKFLLISVLGGLGTVWGALVGGLAVEFLDEGMRRLIPMLVPGASGEVQLIGFGIVLTLIVVLLPGGLHQAWRLLTERLRPAPAPASGTPAPTGAHPAATAGGDAEAPLASLPVNPRRPPRGTPILQVHELTCRFGGVVALDRVSLDVHAGEILALIGPNGAGKTTCFNIISGVLTPTAGTVTLSGRRIDGRKPHVFARERATRTFQNLQVFASTSVLGNVMVGRHLRSRAGLLRALLALPARAEERAVARSADEIVRLLGLAADRDRPAADLPVGRQRLLEVARALATEPDLLLLDEPMAGLSGAERHELARLLRRLRAGGMAIVLVEHDVEAVLALADRVAVLDDGKLIALGTPEQVRGDPAVIAAYLGVEEDAAEVGQAARELAED